MFEGTFLFAGKDVFYNMINENDEKITGYEAFFEVINEFKKKFNYTIHSFGDYEKTISFNFKGDYHISLKELSDGRYITLRSTNSSLDDFTDKYNFLKSLIQTK